MMMSLKRLHLTVGVIDVKEEMKLLYRRALGQHSETLHKFLQLNRTASVLVKQLKEPFGEKRLQQVTLYHKDIGYKPLWNDLWYNFFSLFVAATLSEMLEKSLHEIILKQTSNYEPHSTIINEYMYVCCNYLGHSA